jgi:hypothetical protein
MMYQYELRWAARIDRRKHDEDIAERVIGDVRSIPYELTEPERATADHRTSARAVRAAVVRG